MLVHGSTPHSTSGKTFLLKACYLGSRTARNYFVTPGYLCEHQAAPD